MARLDTSWHTPDGDHGHKPVFMSQMGTCSRCRRLRSTAQLSQNLPTRIRSSTALP